MTTARRAVTAVALSTLGYALAVRPRMLRWGASDEEVRGPYPGADLVQGGRRGATMAITIDAPPSRVWPWLVQMGCDRAGWYSWDRLDNGGTPSAQRIRPEWQTLSVGDHLASIPSGRAWFEVAALEPERFLGLRASLDWRGRPFDPAGPHPGAYVDALWGFWLKAWPGGRTRLIVSGHSVARPQFLQTLAAATRGVLTRRYFPPPSRPEILDTQQDPPPLPYPRVTGGIPRARSRGTAEARCG